MSGETVLFDLPSKGRCACWSLNPWKTRAALNFKEMPYKTEWVEYPDIAPKFEGLGIKPHEGDPKYAIPAARMPDGTCIMESLNIAKALEKLQPEPSLKLDSGYVDRVQDAVMKTFSGLIAKTLPRVPEMLLNKRSAEYFYRTREVKFGTSLQELAKSEKAGEAAWQNAAPGQKELAAILHEHEDGPYVLGMEASYADIVLAGYFAMLKRVDKDGDLFDRFMSFDAAFVKHCEACQKWLERDDR